MSTAVFGGLIAVAVLVAAFYFSPRGWRTVAVNAASGLLVVVTAMLDFLTGFDFKSVLPPQYAAFAVLIVNLVNIGLRTVTTTRLGRCEK